VDEITSPEDVTSCPFPVVSDGDISAISDGDISEFSEASQRIVSVMSEGSPSDFAGVSERSRSEASSDVACKGSCASHPRVDARQSQKSIPRIDWGSDVKGQFLLPLP